MTTRPVRSNRGQRPNPTAQEQEKEDHLYQHLFGANLEDEDDEAETQRNNFSKSGKEKQAFRKMRFLANINKYSYSRGHHYFYNLDNFPRLEGHPSYAADYQNIFGSTYSRDKILYKGVRLGHLLNRVYFGMPITQNEHSHREVKVKNVCHSHLFENEDKKYHLDRLLYTCREVLKNLEGLVDSRKIERYGLISRDCQLTVLTDSDLSMDQKREVLRRKISILEERKISNRMHWQYEDGVYFYHSLNQRLHNQIGELRKKLQLQELASQMIYRVCNLTSMIDQNHHHQSLSRFLHKAFQYHLSEKYSISQRNLLILQEQYSKTILKLNSSQLPLVNFPVQIIQFGSNRLVNHVNMIIGSRLNQSSQTSYFLAKMSWKKIFNMELPLNKDQKQHYDTFIKNARIQIQELQRYYKEHPKEQRQKYIQQIFTYISLDDRLNFAQLTSEQNQNEIPIFHMKQLIEITGKQFLYIILYHWICVALAQLQDFISENQSFLSVVGSNFYSRFNSSVVEALDSPRVGVLNYCIQTLCQFAARPDPLSQISQKLYFQYDSQNNIGIIWRRPPEDDGEWETEKQQEEEDVQKIQDGEEEGEGEKLQEGRESSDNQNGKQQQRQQSELSSPHKRVKLD